MERKERIQSEQYDRNHYCTVFVIVVNFAVGICIAAVEIGQLFYIWSVGHLRYQTEQFMLFGESMPGVWLGFLYIITAITGIVARHTRMNPARRHVRFTLFAALCSIDCVASGAMLGWVGYSIDRMRWDYPQLCKGFPYAGTYDHICDYENGYYNILGLMVPMIILYLIEMVASFFGAVFGFWKVCNCNYKAPLVKY